MLPSGLQALYNASNEFAEWQTWRAVGIVKLYIPHLARPAQLPQLNIMRTFANRADILRATKSLRHSCAHFYRLT